jgi:hypothetical protein
MYDHDRGREIALKKIHCKRVGARRPPRRRRCGRCRDAERSVPDHGADLDQLFLRQRPQEVAKIVGECVKLEPHRVGGERPARQPRPLDRAFALLDPLLARPALVDACRKKDLRTLGTLLAARMPESAADAKKIDNLKSFWARAA